MTDDVDGGFVVSLPLPKDHWIYEPSGDPPAPLPLPASLERDWRELAVWAAGKYVVRGGTMSGRSPDFDSDALIMALVVGLLDYASRGRLSCWAPRSQPRKARPMRRTGPSRSPATLLP